MTDCWKSPRTPFPDGKPTLETGSDPALSPSKRTPKDSSARPGIRAAPDPGCPVSPPSPPASVHPWGNRWGTLVDLQKRPTPDDPELAGFLDPGWPNRPHSTRSGLDRSCCGRRTMTCRMSRSRRAISCSSNASAGPITRRRWSAAEAYGCAQAIYGDNAPSQLAQGEDIDCSYEIRRGRQDLARFRVNMTAARAVREWGLEITIRTIPTTPPTLDQLDLPTDLRAHLAFEQGLVIVTGPTGSGKTTLLGAIIRALLEQPDSHRKIIAYESPIEYVYDAPARARSSPNTRSGSISRVSRRGPQ